MAANKLVNITKAFTLTLLRGGEHVAIKVAAGIQRLEADVADHWYTKAHSEDVPKGVKQSDAEAAAEAAAAAKAAQEKADAEELERMEVEEKAAAEAKAAEEAKAKAEADAAAAAAAKSGKKA